MGSPVVYSGASQSARGACPPGVPVRQGAVAEALTPNKPNQSVRDREKEIETGVSQMNRMRDRGGGTCGRYLER